MTGTIEALVAAEAARPAPPEVQALVGEILRQHGGSVTAVLFYGSCRRTGDISGLVDLYVLHNGHRAFHGNGLPAFLNWLLPPNVLLINQGGIRAKVAVLSEQQFGRRARPQSWDTTIWTRFAQPASLLHARDAEARDRVIAMLAQAVRAAAHWAILLGPPSGPPSVYWQGLFARTYRAEIRPERTSQPALLYQSNAAWFDRMLTAARAEPPAGTPSAWLARRLWGKPLNLLRLAKAAFTFDDGLDYIAWKLQRHGGVQLTVTDWQRRHPILAAPGLLWRLRRLRATR